MKFFVLAIWRLVVPICILGAGGYGFAVLSVEPAEEKGERAPEQVLSSRVQSLGICDYAVTIETHGIVTPHDQVTLSAEVTGTVRSTKTSFEVGSFFKSGELLLELDDRDYRTALTISREQHKLAKAKLELARSANERMEQLAKQNSASTVELDITLAALVQAQSEVEITASSIDQAERDLQRTKIFAPFDGRVVTKVIGTGQLVSPGTVLGGVIAVDYVEVRLPIASRELRHLDLPEMEGDAPVEVELRDAVDPSTRSTWQAKIVRTEGTLDPNSLELYAIARVDDPYALHSDHPILRVGQPVTALVHGRTLHNVVAIPRGAVRRLDQVYLIDKDKHTLRTTSIEPLWSDADNVVVRAGVVREREWLATTTLVYAPEGSLVNVIGDDDSTKSLVGQPPHIEATP